MAFWTKIFWWILGAAIIVRALIFIGFIFYQPNAMYVNDSHEYIGIAENMLDNKQFSRSAQFPYLPESFRTPGYPALLEISKALTGSFYPVLVLQIFAAGLTAFFLWRIARIFEHEREGVIAAGVFLFMPFSLLVSEQFLTQTIFTTTITGAVYAFITFTKSGRPISLLITALLIPLAAYIRPIGGYLYAIFVLILLWGSVRKQIELKTALAASAIIIAAFFAILSPWLIRNYEVFGRAELSSITPAFLYFYEAPAVLKESLHISFEDARKILEQKIIQETGVPIGSERYTNFSPITDIVTKEAIASILSDPKAFALTRVTLTFSFFTRDGIRYVFEALKAPANYIDIQLFRIPMIAERATLLLFLIGFIFLSVKTVWQFRTASLDYFLLILVTLYFAALTGSMASAGLRYPAEPFFLLIGTIGLFEIYAIIRTRLLKNA